MTLTPWKELCKTLKFLRFQIGAISDHGNILLPKRSLICRSCTLSAWSVLIVVELLLTPTSCVDSILINGRGKVDCPGEGFLVNHTTTFMKYALYPSHVNDKG